MTEVNMRALTDSPTNQDIDALGKIGQKTCDICGGPDGHMWLHCDSWTKWMRFGCGCNVMHCDKCSDAAKVKSKEIRTANRIKAEEAEREMLRDIKPGELARLRYRYYDTFDCGEDFRNWVSSVVGDEKMKEYLDVPCHGCGKLLGQPKYTFEDKDGNRSLKTMDEMEEYSYKVLGRDPKTEPFKCSRDSLAAEYQWGSGETEIAFETPIWDYFERKGWGHNDHDKPEYWARFNEAFNATKGPDCGGKGEWSYGHFIYYMPTRTYLGKFMKRGGDWPQVVQSNREQLDKEKEELRAKLGYDHPDFWPEYRKIDEKEQWDYYCGKECCPKQNGTMFI
jgi:hypothetical protein